jgi:hypothetical protein
MGFEKGNKLGKGRPPKADEDKVNQIFINALKEMYSAETDEEAKKTFVKDTLMESQRGQLFIAEHIFGKAPQEVKQTNLNIDATDLTEEEVLRIKTALDNAY